MHKNSDRKRKYRSHWLSHNPEGLFEYAHAYLSSEWDAVNNLVHDHHAGVSLSRGQRELGMVIPPALLYVHHLKLAHDRRDYPVKHIDMAAFKANPKPHIEKFLGGMNYVLLHEGKPTVAAVSKIFRNCELEVVNAEGRVEFNHYRHRDHYPDEHWIIDPQRDAIRKAAIKYFYGDAAVPTRAPENYIPLARYAMNNKDHQILNAVLAHLGAVRIDTLPNHERATENLRIDTAAGSVTDITTGLVLPASQPTDKPTNEA